MDDPTPFVEAERQFRWYTAEAQAGRLSPDAYTAAIGAIRVTDRQGRLWMPQQGSGQWHVWLGDRWMASSPYPTAPPPVAYPPAPPAAAYTPRPAAYAPQVPVTSAPTSNASGCAGAAVKYLVITMIVFALIGAALVIFVEDFPPEGLLGVGLAALISFAIMFNTLNKHWEGEIIDLHTEKVDVSTGDDDADYRDVLFANIREASGKIRKERAMPNWRVGMRLRKPQGKAMIEIVG